jgi:hypothetical protein
MNNTQLRLPHNLIPAVAGIVLACLAMTPGMSSAAGKASPAAEQKAQPAGRLVIVRAANLGSTIVDLKIDGVETAKINYNGRYDAPLAAGPHVLTVIPFASREIPKPNQTRLTVEPGKTYTFTAKRDDVSVVLK